MILLLNILPSLLVVSSLVCWHKYYKTKKHTWKYALFTSLALGLIMPFLQPSYFPKGEIQRTAVPEFAPSTAEIEDRNRQPVDQMQIRASQEQRYRDGPVFIDKK